MKLSLGRKYCIDTSSLIDLDIIYPKERETYKAIWDEIEELINDGLFSTSDFVEKEINEYQGKKTFIIEWIREHKQKLIIPTDSEIIIAASKIINENFKIGFLDPNCPGACNNYPGKQK
jgi:hypothetical protein